MKIIITGSIAYDRIMNFPGKFGDHILPEKIHQINLSFLVKDLKESFGGTAGNIAYNLSLLGLKPSIIGNVGSKDFIVYEQWFRKNQIDISGINILPNNHTASAYIITDQKDNQIAGFYPGAMNVSVTKKLQANSDKLQAKIAIVSPQNPIDMVRFPKIFKQKKVPYIFDPGQQMTTLTSNQLKQAIAGSKVLIGNDYEISLILKKTGWTIPKILKQTEILVITKGDKGSEIRQGQKVFNIPAAKPKNTSDPTGAGDAFRAGLIYGLVNGWSLEKTGRLAGLVSVYTVEKYGTQTHSFTKKELEKRYKLNFGENLF